MLPNDYARCQGASAIFATPVQSGSLPIDCIHCKRRTDIEPGRSYSWMPAPTWLPFQECPKRIGQEVE